MDEWITQLRKGLVEFCVLKAVARQTTYGYQLVQSLRAISELSFTESTVYPVLNRLIGDGSVQATKRKSKDGPPRRYLSLTALGRGRLERMETHWARLCRAIDAFPEKEEAEDPVTDQPTVLSNHARPEASTGEQ